VRTLPDIAGIVHSECAANPGLRTSLDWFTWFSMRVGSVALWDDFCRRIEDDGDALLASASCS
jgi:hypothetical protein